MIHGIIASQLLGLSVPPVAAGTTWDAAQTVGYGGTPGTVVFSDGRRTTKLSGETGVIASHATDARSTGKFYFEILFVGGPSANSNYAAGITNTSISEVRPPGVDADGFSTGIRSSGAVFWFGFQQFTLGTSLIGQTLGIAVDLDAQRLWFRVNENDWNNGPTTDPATGTGGFDYSDGGSIPGTEMVPVHGNIDAGQITGSFKSSDLVYSPPAGFAPWSAI